MYWATLALWVAGVVDLLSANSWLRVAAGVIIMAAGVVVYIATMWAAREIHNNTHVHLPAVPDWVNQGESVPTDQ